MINLLAQVAYWAAEEGEAPPEGIDLVIPAIEELIAGIIAFGIVFLLVGSMLTPRPGRSPETKTGLPAE